jgi:beta-glucanase (GH16 family)
VLGIVVEFRGQDRDTVLHTLHYGGGWPNNRYGGVTKKYNFDFTNDFHEFTLEWDGSFQNQFFSFVFLFDNFRLI